MFKYFKKLNSQNDKLYNKILFLSRNKLFYTKFGLSDTFQNRINLIFIHISFLFIKVKQKNGSSFYNEFYQQMFDLIFNRVEVNMREIGYGDTSVNKNMKILVKTFYSILINCEDYRNKNLSKKNFFLHKYLKININKNEAQNIDLIGYFDKYHSFCLDLSPDKVLKGELNFNYK